MFDLIFLDIHMPIMDGNQTIKELRERERKGTIDLRPTTIIALSAITEGQFKEEPNSRLFDSFMEKPVSFLNLKELFERAI